MYPLESLSNSAVTVSPVPFFRCMVTFRSGTLVPSCSSRKVRSEVSGTGDGNSNAMSNSESKK